MLSGANFVPCLLAQAIHLSWASCSFLQFSRAELLHVNRLVSSTKPNPSSFSSTFCMPSRSSDMKKRKRIGDMGQPWEIPEFAWNQSLSYPSNITRVLLAYMKLLTYPMIHSGSPLRLRIHSSLFVDT